MLTDIRALADHFLMALTNINNVLDGNATKKVAIGVFNSINRTRTPRIHNRPVPGGYASVSVDRVEKGCGSVLLIFGNAIRN